VGDPPQFDLPVGTPGRAAARSLTPRGYAPAPSWYEPFSDPAAHRADHDRDRERCQHLREVERDESVELIDRCGLRPEGLMKLGGDDAPDEEREEERDGRRDGATVPGDDSGAEQDRAGSPSRVRERRDDRVQERTDKDRKGTREDRAATGEEACAKGREPDIEERERGPGADPQVEALVRHDLNDPGAEHGDGEAHA